MMIMYLSIFFVFVCVFVCVLAHTMLLFCCIHCLLYLLILHLFFSVLILHKGFFKFKAWVIPDNVVLIGVSSMASRGASIEGLMHVSTVHIGCGCRH